MKKLIEYLETNFNKNIYARLKLHRKEAVTADFPDTLAPELKVVLGNEGINKLYSHQREAFDLISNGKNTLMVSKTASGKTLSFFLPILNEYIGTSSPFSVLLLYPTKALSRDQESTFGRFMGALKSGERLDRLGTFDGDTPGDERTRIQRSADFLITNPDMLHSGILPNHNRRWKSFLSRLKYVVVDEVHIYRGAFGSHVSNVFRRLVRICKLHGSSPVFICSSATVSNPGRHVEALFHTQFSVVEKDGAPQPDREIFFMNPSLVKSHGDSLFRKGPKSITMHLIREAARLKIRTICFCRSRQEAERLNRAVVDGFPEYRDVIKPYRGGLLPNERRELERDLVRGKINVIISTNALELGIDIGDLELCILSGHPGTVASFWQQSGRVGRKGKSALVVFVAKDTPINQYIVHHPEFITDTPVEQALLNADNPYILMQHLPCAAHEYPLRKNEEMFEQVVYAEALNVLKDEKTVTPYHDTFRYSLQDYPSRGVNLRGMTDYNIEIYCGTEVIGELDPIGARGTLYKDAIYQHLGKRYMSMELDLDKKLCRLEPVDVDYYTEAVWEGRVEMTDAETDRSINGSGLIFGYVKYNKQPKLYKKIRERSYENIGYGPITLPAFEYETTGFSLLPPGEWVSRMDGIDKRYTGAALYGLGYILRHTAPSLCMADVKDISTDVSLAETEPETWKSALYMFDSVEGGVGYSEKVYEGFEECLELCREIIAECSCEVGCPSCVPPLPPGVGNEHLESLLVMTNASTECTTSLINAMLDGNIIIPEIKVTKVPLQLSEPYPEDMEKKCLERKLARAAGSIRKKRERLH